MATSIHHPKSPIAPEQLDAYLSKGWRPAGQGIYTAEFLRADDEQIYGCIQLRLPLTGFSFKKRHRKLLNRNGKRFRHTVDRATTPDAELEALNQRYLALHPEKTRETLDHHVIGEHRIKALDTRIIRIYDGDKLIAFSYFDLGRKTAYSKAGIYDPDYAAHSLGIYTMVLEIQWLQNNGVLFYHPGYVAPRYPIFNYKMQFGQMEFFQLSTGSWLPYDDQHPEDPYDLIEAALTQVQSALAGNGLTGRLVEYPSYTACYHYQTSEMEMLDAALILYLAPTVYKTELIVTYTIADGIYRIVEIRDSGLRDMNVKPFSNNGRARFMLPAMVDEVLASSPSATEIAGLVRNFS
ncbi:GNAT family N-acetyltransferase [Neolewinella aurantiaca]|uniref:GNAT family N-acetyltransferase n=1 Tax=Neolewinella aurantiaca TaxID=2602767 RepID=UPI00164F06AD|nr:GNAT family N-acetyltransferase [Neolewinella aurantiaca]